MRHTNGSSLIVSFCLVAVFLLALAAGCIANETKASAPQGQAVAPATVQTVASASVPTVPAATTSAPVATTAPVPAGQKQTIRISGSTTVLPIVQAAADQYMATHAGADIQITGGGSGAGIQAISAKTVDIGMSSSEVSKEVRSKNPHLTIIPVARDGVAIIVNPANSITRITEDQIKNIYLGRITKWTEISGANVPGTNNQIVVIGRDSASGTRTYFDEKILAKATPAKTMLEKNSNGAVLQTIAQTPGSIGYISVGFVTSDVKAVPLSFNAQTTVDATLENVRTGAYPFSRNLYVITNGEQAGLTGDFITYLLSPEGQKNVADHGYVPVK